MNGKELIIKLPKGMEICGYERPNSIFIEKKTRRIKEGSISKRLI